MTKPNDDSPPQGLNWAQPTSKRDPSGDIEKPEQIPFEEPRPVKGLFDTAQLSEAPPPVGLRGAAPHIPDAPSEPETPEKTEPPASAISLARIELAAMISESLHKDSKAPLAAFRSKQVAEPPGSRRLEAIEGKVRGVFGGGQAAESEAEKPAQAQAESEAQAQAEAKAHRAPVEPGEAVAEDAVADGAEQPPAGQKPVADAAPVEPVVADAEAATERIAQTEALSEPVEETAREAAFAGLQQAERDESGLQAVSYEPPRSEEEPEIEYKPEIEYPPEIECKLEIEFEPEVERPLPPIAKSGPRPLWIGLALLALVAGAGAAVLMGVVELRPNLLPSIAAPTGSAETVGTAPPRTAKNAASARQPAAARPEPVRRTAEAAPAGVAEEKPREALPQEAQPAAKTEGSAEAKAEPAQLKTSATAKPTARARLTAEAADVDPKAGDGSASSTPAKKEDWKSMLRRAVKLQKRGDVGSAEPLFRAVLKQQPDEHHAMKGLVEILLKRNASSEALPFAKRIVGKRSRRVSYRLLYGDALFMAGDEAKAVEQWKEALRLSPGNSAALIRLRKARAEESSEPPAATE